MWTAKTVLRQLLLLSEILGFLWYLEKKMLLEKDSNTIIFPSYNNTIINDPKFLVWVNSVDPDQTAPRGAIWSGSTLFAIPSAPFGCIILWYSHLVKILEWLQQFFQVSEFLGILRIFFSLLASQTIVLFKSDLNARSVSVHNLFLYILAYQNIKKGFCYFYQC